MPDQKRDPSPEATPEALPAAARRALAEAEERRKAAQALALRIWREGGTTDESRADYAYRLCTSRAARPAEIAALRRLLDDKRARIRSGELQASDIAF